MESWIGGVCGSRSWAYGLGRVRWEGVRLAWMEAELALTNDLLVTGIMIEIVLSGNKDALT